MSSYKPPQPIIKEFLDFFSKKYDLKIDVRSKSNPNWILKIVAFFVGLFNDRFMTSYITTISGTIWVPKNFFDKPEKFSLETIAHELIHEYDRKRLTTPIFVLLYFFPQIIAILALLSLIGGGWLWCIFFILCLAPLPAYGRAWIELRGYRMNILYDKYVFDTKENILQYQAENWIGKQFSSSAYYFMWPFKKYVTKKLMNMSEYENEEIYVEILKWLKEKNI